MSGARLQASCPECGATNAEFRPEEIQIIAHTGPGYRGVEYSLPAPQYRFFHKECGRIALKEADERVINLLDIAGCEVVEIQYPDELLESVRNTKQPSFSERDLHSFRKLLWSDYPDELLDPARSSDRPSISSNDLIDFHQQLDVAGWRAELNL